MQIRSVEQLNAADPKDAVEIADRTYWVGHHIEGDNFQCHCYLIEHGDQSVLIDPGSQITFEHTLRKIERIIPFDQIRYFICHHQDPDIAASLPRVQQRVSREDAVIVSHWRGETLMKHYDLSIPFWLIEDHDWRLDLGGRELRFIFTPYLHFPGAFCTFDAATGVLFSSDIFGAFTEQPRLVAADESYFEAMRPFHEHYMPSREVLLHGLAKLEPLPIELIAPQHGSLIPKPLIPYMFERLKELECGLYLVSKESTNVLRMSRINQMLRNVLHTMVLYRDFRDVAQALFDLVRDLLPARSIEFYAAWENDSEVLHFGPATRYRGERVPTPPVCQELCGLDRASITAQYGSSSLQRELPTTKGPTPSLIIPLYQPGTQQVGGLAIVPLSEPIEISADTEEALGQLNVPLQVAIERERIYRVLEMERQDIYEQAIRDPLTGLYTRIYMHEAVKRMLEQHDRDAEAPVALVMFDIDHFKRVNDTYGHLVGDEVLRRVADVIASQLRGSDLAVRLGGEEFGVFLQGRSAQHAPVVAERARNEIAKLAMDGPMQGEGLTISAGVAKRRQAETLEQLLGRADAALYAAKRAGRNQVVTEELPALQL